MKEERIVLKMADNEGTSRYVHHSLTTDYAQQTGTHRNVFQTLTRGRFDIVKHGFKYDDYKTADKEAYDVVDDLEHEYNQKLRKAVYDYTRTQWDVMVAKCEQIEKDLQAELDEKLLRTLEANTGRKRKDVA